MLISLYLAKQVVNPKRSTYENSVKVEKNNKCWFDFDKMEKEEIHIKSFDNYDLFGYYVPNPIPSNKYVIISHGHTWTLSGSIKYLDIYRRLGYNCIVYDDRGHSHNKRTPISMGILESRDLIEVINFTHKKFGEDIYLGLQGESMGSGLEIMALKYKPNVKFVVNDCGYGDLTNVLKGSLKSLHMPLFLLKTANLVSKLIYKVDILNIQPIDSLDENLVPICFMHGGSDKLISFTESENMASKTKGYSEVHIFEGSDHAMSLRDNREEYFIFVKNFLEKVESTNI